VGLTEGWGSSSQLTKSMLKTPHRTKGARETLARGLWRPKAEPCREEAGTTLSLRLLAERTPRTSPRSLPFV